MDEIIRVKNISYDRYEELLMRRDSLNKEAFRYEREYIRKFGDFLLEIFRLKIECIRKKKTIEFCQAAANRGQSVDQDRLQAYLQRELKEFQAHLNAMLQDNEAAKQAGQITEMELLQIRKIYHKLAKQIHPDINPMVANSEVLKELWQRVIVAYNCNDLQMMQETELLVSKALEQYGQEIMDIEIPDIDEKIEKLEQEIIHIRESDPYQYKYLLEDEEAVREKNDSLNEEKKSYEEYAEQLDEILKGLLNKGVTFTWRMN